MVSGTVPAVKKSSSRWAAPPDRNKLEFDDAAAAAWRGTPSGRASDDPSALRSPICSRAVPQEIVIYSVIGRPYKFRSNNRAGTVEK